MHDEHREGRCSSRAAPWGTWAPAQDEHLLILGSPSLFGTFTSPGRPEGGDEPAQGAGATDPHVIVISLSFHYHFIS